MRIVYTPEAVVLHKLQAATHRLRSDPTEFETLFVRNEWPPELRAELGFRKAIWE
jgi:hypothetical protein